MRRWIAGLLVGLFSVFGFGLISHAQDGVHHTPLQLVSYTSNADNELMYRSPARSLPVKSSTPAASPSQFGYISNKELVVSEGLRLMVFSPHPDDESLAASGIIQRVHALDGQVNVVFMTNGDGYPQAVKLYAKRAKLTASDFISYGKKRREEAVQAVCEMGLQAQDITFLGYPDDGIDDLWAGYWSRLRPFTSPYTRYDRPRREGKLSRWAKYAGVDLEAEIARTIADFKPDWIVIPDPRDCHPDHATTGVFVMDALRKLDQEGVVSFGSTTVLSYLVHFKDYPGATTWAKEIGRSGVCGSPLSSKILSTTEWLSLPLTNEEVNGKQRAISAHQTQSEVLGNFMKQFVRPCELFGRLDAAQIVVVPQVYAAYFKRSSS